MAWEEEEVFKWEEGEQQRLRWGEEQDEEEEEEVRIRLVEEKERETLMLQGPERESESMHWGGRNGCSEGVRTKNPEETDFLRDCDGGEESCLGFQEGTKRSDDGDRTLDDNEEEEGDEEEGGDEEEKKEEEKRRGRRGSRSDSLHFFLEQLVGDEGWRECVEVTIFKNEEKLLH